MPEPKPRRAVTALALALAVSLAGNAWLARSEEQQRRTVNAVRLDPAGAQVYAVDRARPPPARPTLVLFGDSRALMWSPPALPDYEVLDRGIGNQTTAQVLLRVDDDVAPLHPTVVVLEAGINDLKAIPELPARRNAIVAGCEANLQTLVARLRATGATVVLTTIFSVGDVPVWRRPFWSDDVQVAVREVNAFLHGLAGDRVVLFEADPVLDDGGKVKPGFQFDYLHLLPAGYAALNEKLVPLVHGLPAPAPR